MLPFFCMTYFLSHAVEAVSSIWGERNHSRIEGVIERGQNYEEKTVQEQAVTDCRKEIEVRPHSCWVIAVGWSYRGFF